MVGTSMTCQRRPWWRDCPRWTALYSPPRRSPVGRNTAPRAGWRRLETCVRKTGIDSLMRPSHAIAPGDCASFSPQIFFNARACGALVGDSGMTQPGACRSAAVPKRDARADAPKVERTEGSYRLPAAPLSSKKIPRTGGFATPPYGRFAFVSVRPEGRGPLI